MSNKMPAYIRMLLKEKGATSEELRVAMNRVWGPTRYQLAPIAKREGYNLKVIKAAGEYHRYRFVPKASRKPAAEKQAA